MQIQWLGVKLVMPLVILHRKAASDLQGEHSKTGQTIQILCTLHPVVVGKERT